MNKHQLETERKRVVACGVTGGFFKIGGGKCSICGAGGLLLVHDRSDLKLCSECGIGYARALLLKEPRNGDPE